MAKKRQQSKRPARHNTREALSRRIAKLDAALAKSKARAKRLRDLLDARSSKLTEMWGHLQDIRTSVSQITDVPEVGDWEGLVKVVREIVDEHARLEVRVHKQDTEAAPEPETTWWRKLQRKIIRRP